MGLKEKVENVLADKEKTGQYVDEARLLLPELQEFMGSILEAQDPEDSRLIQYLLGIVKDTVAAMENQDEVLLKDVLEYGWCSLIIDVMGDVESDNI